MEFVHRPLFSGDTIAALATPPGEGGIAIIRISGKGALFIAEKLFSKPIEQLPSHTLHFGKIHDLHGTILDEALLVIMRAPRSYTGEDTVEFQCHGGALVAKKILEACLAAGARVAGPGEFTFRAFLNGKMDLARAESIQKLIQAKNDTAYAAACTHLKGNFSKVIQEFKKELVSFAAILEAWVDFPEEGIEFATREDIVASLSKIMGKIQKIVETYQDGQKIEQGIRLCILGPPNAGKSSLMNALLGKDRAIVTPIAGTTRDLLHEDLQLGGLHFKLTDTAGIRETEEAIEKEGIRRSFEALREADLVLLVLDAQMPIEENLYHFLPQEKTIVVWNKIDLSCSQANWQRFSKQVRISAKEGLGLNDLKESILAAIWEEGPPTKDEIIITSLRHKEALVRAVCHLEKVREGLERNISPEFLTLDIRGGLFELGTIIGSNVTEDILTSIFSQFCIGK